jgi:hypothetical protein
MCLSCGREVGYCPACRAIVVLLPADDEKFRCGNATCGALLEKCYNYVRYNVCNRCYIVDSVISNGRCSEGPLLCDCCRFTRVIPDLDVPGNLEKWYRLEAAKRRLFYELDLLQLPRESEEERERPALHFDFKGDMFPPDERRGSMSPHERVFTGHAQGTITINIREADDVERERLRAELGEPQRTLLGHFRHEIGHYYWDLLIKNKREADFAALFGDPTTPSYQEALNAYYQDGPPVNWQSQFVSAYATMHPWEDFAETFAHYLDIISMLDTAYHVGFSRASLFQLDLNRMIVQYQQLGIALNELNRSRGIIDIIPEVLTLRVREKLHFVHHLVVDK